MRNPQVQLIQWKVDRNLYRVDQSLNKQVRNSLFIGLRASKIWPVGESGWQLLRSYAQEKSESEKFQVHRSFNSLYQAFTIMVMQLFTARIAFTNYKKWSKKLKRSSAGRFVQYDHHAAPMAPAAIQERIQMEFPVTEALVVILSLCQVGFTWRSVVYTVTLTKYIHL